MFIIFTKANASTIRSGFNETTLSVNDDGYASEASGSVLFGLCGDSARVGYSNGTGEAGTLLELEGSAVNGAFINGGSNALNTGSNIGEAVRYVFSAKSGNISNPPVNASAPGSVALLGLALFALGMLRRMTK